MLNKQVIMLNVWILLTFIGVSVLQGAHKPDDIFALTAYEQDTHAWLSRPKRSEISFAVGEDKLGFCHFGKDLARQNQKMLRFLLDRPCTYFPDVESKAYQIYGCGGDTSALWARVAGVVRQEPRLDIDLTRKCLVTHATPCNKRPKESIEKAIYRIYTEEPAATSKRDLVFMLYKEGYRDYTYRAIVGKRSVLVCVGFCPKQNVGENYSRTIGYWQQIKNATEEKMNNIFLRCHNKDVDTVYQMIYMKKHGIIEDLGKYIESDNGETLGDALERQDKILQYLQERAGQPCMLFSIAKSLGSECRMPKGVLYEIAKLMFSGRAAIAYNDQDSTCTLVPQETMPVRSKELCDELVLFQNTRKCIRVEEAILQTYCQGYRAYHPAKMVLFKNGFDIMNLEGNLSWHGSKALSEFLQRHKEIPPVWKWDAEMEAQGRDFVHMIPHRALDAIFEMHNRGTLDIVKTYANSTSSGAKQKFVMGSCLSVIKKRLSEEQHCGLKQLAEALVQTNGEPGEKIIPWTVVLGGVSGFIQHVHYNIEQDKFTWIDTPEPLQDATEDAAVKEACALTNRYPWMSVQCLTFVLLHKGFAITPERIYLISHGLKIAGLVLSDNKKSSPFSKRCKDVFAFFKNQESPYTNDAQIMEEYERNGRVRYIVAMALKFCENDELKAIAKSSECVQKCKRVSSHPHPAAKSSECVQKRKRVASHPHPAALKKAKCAADIVSHEDNGRCESLQRVQVAEVSPEQFASGILLHAKQSAILQEDSPQPATPKHAEELTANPALNALLMAVERALNGH